MLRGNYIQLVQSGLVVWYIAWLGNVECERTIYFLIGGHNTGLWAARNGRQRAFTPLARSSIPLYKGERHIFRFIVDTLCIFVICLVCQHRRPWFVALARSFVNVWQLSRIKHSRVACATKYIYMSTPHFAFLKGSVQNLNSNKSWTILHDIKMWTLE